MAHVRRSYLCALGIYLAAALVWQPANAAEPGVNLEGTWKIVKAQDAFKPEGGAVPFTEYPLPRAAGRATPWC